MAPEHALFCSFCVYQLQLYLSLAGRKFVLPTRLHSSVPPTKESFTDTAEVSDDKDYEDAIFYQKAGHEDRTRYRGTDNTGSENVGTNIQTADTTKAIPAGTIDY